MRQNCVFVYVEIDLETYTMRTANAGCIPPYIKRSRPDAQPKLELLDVGGLPLGSGKQISRRYQEVAVQLEKDDRLIFVSDGVIEAVNGEQAMFQFDRLETAILTGPHTTARAILKHLLAKVEMFIGDTEPHDDLTIVVIKI